MGGQNHECVDCHDDVKAPAPEPLNGRAENMGGPQGCTECHYEDGKAIPLPLPEGYDSCVNVDCHPSKK